MVPGQLPLRKIATRLRLEFGLGLGLGLNMVSFIFKMNQQIHFMHTNYQVTLQLKIKLIERICFHTVNRSITMEIHAET